MIIKLSPEQFAAKLAAVGKLTGQNLSGPSGDISHSGVTVSYRYDGGGSLVIDVVKKPFFVSEAYVEQQITAWFAGS